MQERKRKYEEENKNPEINKAMWNEERKKWIYSFTQTGYIQPIVREVFIDKKMRKVTLVTKRNKICVSLFRKATKR